jgi:hypothetical protein
MREKLKDDPAELSVWIKVQQIKSGPSTDEEQPTTRRRRDAGFGAIHDRG